jgi:hypothetical protein
METPAAEQGLPQAQKPLFQKGAAGIIHGDRCSKTSPTYRVKRYQALRETARKR